jgi:hypothetical protein
LAIGWLPRHFEVLIVLQEAPSIEVLGKYKGCSYVRVRTVRPFAKNVVMNPLKMVVNVVISPEGLETMRESQDI